MLSDLSVAPRSSRIGLADVSLILVGLMWFFPFLHYRHHYPLTTFYQEWWSALLGVLALSLLGGRAAWVRPRIPRIAQLPIAFIVVVFVQFALGWIAYFEQAILYVLYLLFAALLMCLGANLRDRLSMAKLAQVLAVFLLAGAELNAMIGLVQQYHWPTPLDTVIVMKVASSVFGNIAQANHFANYMTLGLISLGLLYQRGLAGRYVTLLAVPLLFVMALSGSRSSWLYLLLLVGLAWLIGHRNVLLRPLLRYSLLLIAGFGLVHLTLQLPFLAGSDSSINTVQRLFGHEASGGIRLYLWREASLIFMQSPWLGSGFGQFAWQHFRLVPQLHPGGIVGLYNNAHNILFQLAAETGLVGLLALCVPLVVWLRGLRCAALDAVHWWGYAILGVLAIHSLLEYPLWYAYFLAIAAILLGALDEKHYFLKLPMVWRLTVLSVLLAGMLVLVELRVAYQKLESAMVIRPVSSPEDKSFEHAWNDLLELRASSLLAPYSELFMSSLTEVSDRQLDRKLALNTRVMRFVPVSSVVYRQVLLLAQAGQQESARVLLKQAVWSYPEGFAGARKQMVKLAEKDPVHFSALLEFALQTEQEHLHAVRNK